MEVWLWDMSWIDERTGACKAEFDRLSNQKRSNNIGVCGPLEELPAPLRDERNDLKRSPEVTSVIAEICYRLGYLTLDRMLSKKEWKQLRSSSRKFAKGDWHLDEVLHVLGVPSLSINCRENSRDQVVLCYAGEDKESSWVFFDFEFNHHGYKDADLKRHVIDRIGRSVHPDFNNPLLRNLRIPWSTSWRIVPTEYGRRIITSTN